MKKTSLLLIILCAAFLSNAQPDSTVSKKDRKKDVSIETTMGTIVIRLSDSTPLHRDNFLKLVKTGYYDSLLFHRVIKNFMIQGGDPNSRMAKTGDQLGSGGPSYRIPAEFRQSLFHKKGVIAAARNDNPAKMSSGSQFYITHGKIYTDAGLDSLGTGRLGRKMPLHHREAYKTIGGVPFLDQGYTVYGEVVKGLEVVDRIAVVPTSRDRPLDDVRIIKAKLIKRKKK